MFGIPLEVISMLASTLLGGYMKMKSDARQDEFDRNMLTLKLLNQEEKSRNSARQHNTPNANWARKFIVMSLMGMAMFILIAPVIFDQPTNVMYDVTHGFKLWLFDFTWTSLEWKSMLGIVTPEWLPYAILNVLGFYFGTGAVSRK